MKAKANPEARIFEEESTERLVDKTGTVRVRSCGLKAVNDFRKALERGGCFLEIYNGTIRHGGHHVDTLTPRRHHVDTT